MVTAAPAPVRRATAAVDDRALALAVVMVGLGVRLAFAFSRRHHEVGGDAYYFHEQANLVADGHGYVHPLVRAVEGVDVAAADHPPLYSTYLALWSMVGARSPLWHLVASALLGTTTVALVMAAARRLAGARVGLLAGVAAALHPNLWVWDGVLLSETAACTAVAAFLWCAVRMLEGPSTGRLVAVGVAVGGAALARSELVLLAVALVPLAHRLPRRGHPSSRPVALGRLGSGAVAVVALAGVVVPWAAYNQNRFEHPVPLSTGAGLVLVSSNCDTTYGGPLLGYWDFECSVEGVTQAGLGSQREASVADRALRDDALDFASENRGRLPIVALARLGRATGLFRPTQQVGLFELSEGLPHWVSAAAMGTWYLLAALAALGVRALRRGRVPLSALLAPVGLVLVVAVLVYGIWRFRAPGDVAVCLLAGVGADALIRRHLDGGSTRPPGDGILGRSPSAPDDVGPAPTDLDGDGASRHAPAAPDRRVVRRRPG